MKKLFLTSIVAILFSVLMTGCGGEGCSTATTPPIIVDPNPPIIVDPNPPTNVDPNAPIVELDPTLLNIEFD